MSYAKVRRRLTRLQRRRVQARFERALDQIRILHAILEAEDLIRNQRLAEIDRYPHCPIQLRALDGIHACALPKGHPGQCRDMHGFALTTFEISPAIRPEVALFLGDL